MASDLSGLLTSRLKRIISTSPSIAPGTHRATVVAVAARKGGVGKTTTAVHLAAGLALWHGCKTLVVDLDPQGHVGASLGVGPRAAARPLSAVLDERQGEVLEAAVASHLEGLDLTPPDRQMGATEQLMTAKIGKEFILDRALRITRTHYDVIVLDCPPALGNLTISGLVAADLLLIPCDYSLLSFQGVADMMEAVDLVRDRLGARLEILGIAVTKLDRRTQRVNREVERLLDETYGPLLLDQHIGTSAAIPRAQAEGRTVFESAPRSRGATDYRRLVDALSARLVSSRPA